MSLESLTSQNVVAGYNLQIVLAEVAEAVAFVGVAYLFSHRVRMAAVGAVLAAFGIISRIGYWWLAYVYAGPGENWASWAVGNRWILLLTTQIGVIGTILMLNPILKRVFGRWWLVVGLGFFVGVFVLGAHSSAWMPGTLR